MSIQTTERKKIIMPLVQVRGKAQITLPNQARKVLGIQEGDYLEVRFEKNSLVLKPKKIVDKFPEFVLSSKEKKRLQKALDNVKAGKFKEFDNMQDLINNLHG